MSVCISIKMDKLFRLLINYDVAMNSSPVVLHSISSYMKYFWMIVFSFFLVFGLPAQMTGLWEAVDETDDTPRSIVRIYEQDNKLYGRVERLLPAATITHCTGCTGEMKNKPLKGMLILYDLEKNANGGSEGKILDPKSGKMYSCYIELVSPDKLKVRGYVGLSAFGKTMYWHRAK